ncbi:MAG TPA: aminopeptidase P family N-terminal domain-containing protein, partial [Syntrophales bacterium]|nr:aminopeptidase P family N-terminal domain-containing protein [Syntrophales bacterium]
MERRRRIESLQEKLSRENLQGAIITYSRNILYYTGTAQPAWLVVTPLDYVLSVRSGHDFAVREAFIPQDRIREERKLDRVVARCFAAGEGPGFGRIGVESDIWT